MLYQVSPDIDKGKIFVVNKSFTFERLDAQYHKEQFNFENYHRLSEYVAVKGGKRIPKGLDYTCDRNSPYLYLRVADLTDELRIDYKNIKRIDKTLYQRLESYKINNGEIAFSIAGSVGKIAHIDEIPSHHEIILTENCAKILVRDKDILSSKYLSILLILPLVQKQIRLNYVQTTIPKLSLDRIGRIMIPAIPDKATQENIVNIFYKALEIKRLKDEMALQLLAGIDEYILGKLGITFPETKKSTIADRSFFVNLGNLNRGRMDSNYFDRKYCKMLECIRRGKYLLASLKDVTTFVCTGYTPKGINYSDVETPFPIIKAGSYTGYKVDLTKVAYVNMAQPYTIERGDIFILCAAHQAEYVAKNILYLEDEPKQSVSFVGELLCIRCDKSVNSTYLHALLSTELYKRLLNREKRGQTSHLYAQDVNHILIPLPSIEIQSEIAENIRIMRTQAKKLQDEGKEVLAQAKKDVEKIIMG